MQNMQVNKQDDISPDSDNAHFLMNEKLPVESVSLCVTALFTCKQTSFLLPNEGVIVKVLICDICFLFFK